MIWAFTVPDGYVLKLEALRGSYVPGTNPMADVVKEGCDR